MKIGELFVELGFHSDTMQLDDFIKKIGTLDMSSLLAATGLGGIYEALKDIMEISVKAGMEMYKYNTITGMSAQQMDSWSKFAQQMGADGNLVADTFKKLQYEQQRAKTFGMTQDVSTGIGMVLNRTGVNLLKTYYGDVAKYYDSVRDGIKGVDDASKRQILSLLGISEQNLLLMKQSDEVYAQRNTQATLDIKQVEELKTFFSEATKIAQLFNTVLAETGAKLAEIANPIVKATAELAEFLEKTKAITKYVEFILKYGPHVGNVLKFGKFVGEGVVSAFGAEAAVMGAAASRGMVVQNITNSLHATHVMDKKELEEFYYRSHHNVMRQANDGLPGRWY